MIFSVCGTTRRVPWPQSHTLYLQKHPPGPWSPPMYGPTVSSNVSKTSCLFCLIPARETTQKETQHFYTQWKPPPCTYCWKLVQGHRGVQKCCSSSTNCFWPLYYHIVITGFTRKEAKQQRNNKVKTAFVKLYLLYI
jgi:hypothetical protein